MAIESDAEGDLALDADDAENVAGGKRAKTPKPELPTPAHGVGSHPKEPPKRSLEGLESH